MIEIFRQYLEIKGLNNFVEVKKPNNLCKIEILDPPNFQLNKFFYKQIGKKHRWIDRLIWSDEKWMTYISNKNLETYVISKSDELNWTDQIWINYINNKNVKTFILKEKSELVGYFEQILNRERKEYEIAYFGILEEHRNKGYGGYLLSDAIKKPLEFDAKRVWVHTCSLDHKNAIKNYLARGMKVFKEEKIKIPA